MRNVTTTIDDFLSTLTPERHDAFVSLWKTIEAHIPVDFGFGIAYGMIGWEVPLSRYPSGYDGRGKQPLPFLGIASQKHYIAVYHMGLYCMNDQAQWFREEYAKRVRGRLDMGKSCIRLRKLDAIPYELIAELVQRISVDDFIEAFERNSRRH
jgi:hypothetical protein